MKIFSKLSSFIWWNLKSKLSSLGFKVSVLISGHLVYSAVTARMTLTYRRLDTMPLERYSVLIAMILTLLFDSLLSTAEPRIGDCSGMIHWPIMSQAIHVNKINQWQIFIFIFRRTHVERTRSYVFLSVNKNFLLWWIFRSMTRTFVHRNHLFTSRLFARGMPVKRLSHHRDDNLTKTRGAFDTDSRRYE